jgi:septal ring factor EnvC (AmiA/AmiB activator)
VRAERWKRLNSFSQDAQLQVDACTRSVEVFESSWNLARSQQEQKRSVCVHSYVDVSHMQSLSSLEAREQELARQKTQLQTTRDRLRTQEAHRRELDAQKSVWILPGHLCMSVVLIGRDGDRS